MKRISVLGSTGSIGVSTLAAVESHPDRFEIVCLTAGRNIELLQRQAVEHCPALVCVARRSDAQKLAAELPDTKVVWGAEGLLEAACHARVEMVMVALVGAVGLAPTMAAIRACKHVALANKEVLVVAGKLVMDEAERAGIDLLPVDSEHSAIHQALRVGPEGTASRLILTASGGPFRTWPAERIAAATVQDALSHPTWRMGPKISVDSATMMNKGLEVIEAHHLFGFPEERIDILIHPQSVVHSLVEYVDGTSIAQLSTNDMRCSILYALSWPERYASTMESYDLARSEPLSFEPPDEDRFPAITLARAALRGGGEFPAVLNAANEVAVGAFLDGLCPLPAVAETAEAILDSWTDRNRPLATIEQALEADREARVLAETALRKYGVDFNRSEIRC